MPSVILGTIIGFCAAMICAALGQITLIETLTIYSITGTAAVILQLGLATNRVFPATWDI